MLIDIDVTAFLRTLSTLKLLIIITGMNITVENRIKKYLQLALLMGIVAT